MIEFFPITPKDLALLQNNCWSIENRPEEDRAHGELVYIGGQILNKGRTFQYFYDAVFNRYWYETIFRKEDGTFEGDFKHVFGHENKIKRPR